MTTKLLWADEDTQFTSIGQRYLAATGFDVTMTTDAVNCLSRINHMMPDVLVLDDELKWGGVDGLLAWLLEEVTQEEQPVVLLSSDEPPERISARTEIPEARCLQKPYRMRSILEGITEEMNRRKGRQRQCHESIGGEIQW